MFKTRIAAIPIAAKAITETVRVRLIDASFPGVAKRVAPGAPDIEPRGTARCNRFLLTGMAQPL
jgi:hypothetical protein